MRENGEKGRAISAVDALLIAIVLLFIRCRINEHTHTNCGGNQCEWMLTRARASVHSEPVVHGTWQQWPL